MQKIEKITLSTNFPIGPVNVYLLYGKKITLIDAGVKTKQAWKELNEGLHKMGLTIFEIEQIVITHHHDDHIGLLEWILEIISVPVYAHKNTQTYLQDEDYMYWSHIFFKNLLYEFGLSNKAAREWSFLKSKRELLTNLRVTKELKEGDVIPNLPEWRIIETQGHSQDHISLYCAKDRILICGDHVIDDIHVGLFLDAPFPGEKRAKPLLQYINNLKKCLSFPVEITYSGHGTDIYDLESIVNAQLRRTEKRATRLKNTLSKGEKTGLDIIKDMYPDRYENLIVTFVLEITSLLDLLIERNEVIAKKRNGIYLYRLIE
ncbi:MBL fold metallo-hydrolase [Lentibacillus kimchii]|uniref:MBL fold metallo-hydrolase n=1 Tax=Lentibacillus kimchii TaxID=1542911 RepID=A0ABW2UVZ0_9BACI